MGLEDSLSLLDSVLINTPHYSTVSDTLKKDMLKRAVFYTRKDTASSQTNYDYFFAALSLLPFLKSFPQVTNVSSEGTSVSTTSYDWDSLEKFLKSQSVIYQQNYTGFGVLSIPECDPIVPTYKYTGGFYADADTDIA